jgi:septum formation protein
MSFGSVGAVHRAMAGDIELVLASGSPRRHRILAAVGLPCAALAPNLPEEPRPRESAWAYALRSAQAKYARIRRDRPSAVIIAADTVVSLDGQRLGKPKNNDHAMRMLTMLSSRWHRVLTALTVGSPSRVRSAVTQSLVKFRTLTAAEIALYLSTGEPLDKAGAYGLQGAGAMLVERIEGSCTNVAGFPLESFFLLLEDILDSPWTRYARPPEGETFLWP